jgi:hypothetical protein
MTESTLNNEVLSGLRTVKLALENSRKCGARIERAMVIHGMVMGRIDVQVQQDIKSMIEGVADIGQELYQQLEECIVGRRVEEMSEDEFSMVEARFKMIAKVIKVLETASWWGRTRPRAVAPGG